MKVSGCEIHAKPFITDAYCKCGESLVQVSNGFFSIAMYCPKCENVYGLKLIKYPAKYISAVYINQCRKEARQKGERENDRKTNQNLPGEDNNCS